MEDIEVNFFLIMFSLNLFITTSIEVFANSLAILLQNQVIQAGLGGRQNVLATILSLLL